MKPSEYTKSHGLTLKQIEDATGQSKQTLINWYKNKPELFNVVVQGVKHINAN